MTDQQIIGFIDQFRNAQDPGNTRDLMTKGYMGTHFAVILEHLLTGGEVALG